MAALSDAKALLALVRPLLSAGIALHRLKPRSKRPEDLMWSTAPTLSYDEFAAAYKAGENVGVRLGEPSKTPSGYLHLIDLDIRNADVAEAAHAALAEILPGYFDFPTVVSGSGGASRHFYFFSPVPYASKKLAHSETFAMVFDKQKNRDVKKWDWEIELFGTGKQAVIPPSIHPETDKPYYWEKPLDISAVALGLHAQTSIADLPVSTSAPAEKDLLSIFLDEPVGLSVQEAKTILADLPDEDWCDDRDGWLQAGMALHHEFRGSDEGFALWDQWSSKSEKYDKKDQKRVWRSFGEYRGRPVRMPTLVKAASIARLDREHEELDESAPTDIVAEFDDLPSTSSAVAIDDLLGPPAKTFDKNWKSYLQINEDGGIKATLHNVELIIRNDTRFRGIAAFNEFCQEVVQIATPGTFKLAKPSPKPVRQLDGPIWFLKDGVNGDLWSDSHDHSLRTVIEAPTRQGGFSLKVSDRDLRAAIDIVAHENAFHPVRDYLMNLRWDGENRIERLFVDYLGCADTPYHRSTAAMFLVGAVARVMEPGHKFDFVPILEGLQGKRKSTFAATLAGNEAWFSELEGDFHDVKGMVEKMQGSWIIEIPELQGFSKADVTTIKGFISRQSDKVRMAYAKRASIFDRQCVFIGSTNEDQYLRDETGNRRFWPISCDVDIIDTDRLRRERDQLWAEALFVYQQMRKQQPFGTLPLYLTDTAAQEEALIHQEGRRLETQEEGLSGEIERWLDLPVRDGDGFDEEDENRKPVYRTETCIVEIWMEMLGRDLASLDQRQSIKIGKALRMLNGWYSAGRGYTNKYGRQRIFRRMNVSADDILD